MVLFYGDVKVDDMQSIWWEDPPHHPFLVSVYHTIPQPYYHHVIKSKLVNHHDK